MAQPSLPVRLGAEAFGTALLVATVVGSGIMGERLAGGNEAVALLCNTFPTAAILVVIITVLGPVSGAHFNPAISIVLTARGYLPPRDLAPYVLAQVGGAVLGVAVAHLMFEYPPLMLGDQSRDGVSQWLSEFIATLVLTIAILGGLRHRPTAVPWLVGLAIAAAYWFTASTSFANPAVAFARGLTATFSGIALSSVPGFAAAEIAAALAALGLAAFLFPEPAKE